MHTNFDGLARLRIEEHEAYARQRHLQRIATEAKHRRRAGARSARGGLVLVRGRVAALAAMALILAAALTAIIG